MIHVTILFSTHNRAEVLRQTLEGMCAVDRAGLDVEIVVVDNNSRDWTADAIESFRGRLPIRHLYQGQPGKSAALNLALETVKLGEVVVFTDDDVIPARDWLQRIWDACERHPEFSVFGGKLTLSWPTEGLPSWARRPEIAAFFAAWELPDKEAPYPEGCYPAGAHFWVRRPALRGHRFNEACGPGESARTGEDKLFLMGLAGAGYPPIYIPSAELAHVVQLSQLNWRELRQRSFRRGRSAAYKSMLRDPNAAYPGCRLERFRRRLSAARKGVLAVLTSAVPREEYRVASLRRWWEFGYGLELLSRVDE